MARFILSAFADEAGSALEEQIAALKRNGIDYIEPRNINGKPILTLTDEELADVKAELDKNGIKVTVTISDDASLAPDGIKKYF